MLLLLTIGSMMSSCRKNSILQNAYCKGVLIFLYIIIYLLYWFLISTSIYTPYAVHISDVQYTYTNNLPKFTMTQIMPQNVLLTPIPFGIRNGIIWTPALKSFSIFDIWCIAKKVKNEAVRLSYRVYFAYKFVE